MKILHLLVLLGLGWFDCVLTAHNVTVDDSNPTIRYTGAWSTSAAISLNVGGNHQLTQDRTATALFTFTGVAVYFISPLWPYAVTTAVSLDNGPTTIIDLVDHTQPDTGGGVETVASHAVWGRDGLPDTQHTLLIFMGVGEQFAIVDALIYTVLDPGDLTSSTSQSTNRISSTLTPSSTSRNIPSASSTPTAAATSTTSLALPIALGTALGILALAVIIVAFFFCCRRRERRDTEIHESWTVENKPPSEQPRGASAPSAEPSFHVGSSRGGHNHVRNLSGQEYVPRDTWPYPPYGHTGMSPPVAAAPLGAASASYSYSGDDRQDLRGGASHSSFAALSEAEAEAEQYHDSRAPARHQEDVLSSLAYQRGVEYRDSRSPNRYHSNATSSTTYQGNVLPNRYGIESEADQPQFYGDRTTNQQQGGTTSFLTSQEGRSTARPEIELLRDSRVSSRYQANTLSSITEFSIPQSSGGNQPTSSYPDSGYDAANWSGGSDKMSSMGGESRPTSSFQQYYGSRDEKVVLSTRSVLVGGEKLEGAIAPPAYTSGSHS